jgi:hypothetical protein
MSTFKNILFSHLKGQLVNLIQGNCSCAIWGYHSGAVEVLSLETCKATGGEFYNVKMNVGFQK